MSDGLNICNFGAIGDGVTDDTDAIQEVINFASDRNSSVIVPFGTFLVGTIFLPSNINIIGTGGKFIANSDDIIILSASGTKASAFSNLSVNSIKGSSTLTFVDDVSSIVNSGDYINIYSDKAYYQTYPNQPQGEIRRVSNVSDHIITIEGKLWDNYNTIDEARAAIISPLQNITVDGLILEGINNTGNGQGIFFDKVINSITKNCSISDCGDSGVAFSSCLNCRIVNNNISGSKLSNTGYGISVLNASNNIKISNNDVANCKHCFAWTGSNTEGVPRLVYLSHNTMSNAIESIIDAHEIGEYLSIDNNIVFDGTAEGIKPGCRQVSISNNTILNVTQGIMTRGNLVENMNINDNFIDRIDDGIYLTSTGLKKITVSNNMIDERSDNGIYIDCSNCVSAKVSGNNLGIPSHSYWGININNVNNASIIDNTITGSIRAGIYLNTITDGTIVGNIIKNPGMESGAWKGDAGIYIDACTGLIINDNRVRDDNAHITYGVHEAGASDYNFIRNNVSQGNTGAVVSIVGAHSVQEGNSKIV